MILEKIRMFCSPPSRPAHTSHALAQAGDASSSWRNWLSPEGSAALEQAPSRWVASRRLCQRLAALWCPGIRVDLAPAQLLRLPASVLVRAQRSLHQAQLLLLYEPVLRLDGL